jgi:hypothetical protein
MGVSSKLRFSEKGSLALRQRLVRELRFSGRYQSKNMRFDE